MRPTKQFPSDTKGVLPKQVPSEKKLVLNERIANGFTVVLIFIGAVLIIIGFVQTVDTRFFRPSPMVPWVVFVPATLAIGLGLWAGITYSNKYSNLRRYYYQELQKEGTIDKLIFDDNAKHLGVRLALVKGKNRMGGVAFQVVAVPAKQVDVYKFKPGQTLKL